jgi:ABC-type lipoprotein release transport system permease subunit
VSTKGGRAAAGAWARHDLRRRWLSLVALGLLAGMTVGFALAAFAGARRTSTALSRLRGTTVAADAIVFPSQVGALTPDFAALAAKPEVRRVAIWDLLFGAVNGQQGALIFGSDDGTFQGSVNRPVVVKGRMYSPASPDEIVVDENAAKFAPLGSSISWRAMSPDATSSSATATGPTFTLHVVGVIREVDEFLFVPDGQVFTSPAFVNQNRKRMLVHPNAEVVLTNGEAGIPALKRDAGDILAPGTPVLDLHQVSRRVTTTISVERAALLLLAGAVVLAGGFLVAQALIRSAAVIGDDAGTLRAIGMTKPEVGLAGGLPYCLTTLLAGGAGFLTALAASKAFPVGLGRQIEPDTGFHIDWAVIGPGILLTMILVLGTSMLVARKSYTARTGRITTPSAIAAWIRRWAPLTLGLGAGMAFERGRGPTSIPVRPALAGAVVGVLGIVATLSINQGIHHALAHPELAGVTWDVGVTPDPASLTPRSIDGALSRAVQRAAGDGSAVAVGDRAVVAVNGIGVPTFAFRAPDGSGVSPIGLTLTSGHAPEQVGQAAIGPATAKDLGVKVGDAVLVGDHATSVRIVGVALFPTDVHAEFDEGLWLSADEYDSVVPPVGGQANIARILAVRFADGAPRPAAVDHLQGALASFSPAPTDASASTLPPELTNLHNIRLLPDVLAAFLALVAIGAVSHVLVTSTRRRRRDFAVLRALGLGRGGTRLMLNAQGTAIGLFGLVMGVPLGLAAGRSGWRLVAERVPLAVVPPFALLAVLLLIPGAVVTVNALAVWPGRTVARRGLPAEALRAE